LISARENKLNNSGADLTNFLLRDGFKKFEIFELFLRRFLVLNEV